MLPTSDIWGTPLARIPLPRGGRRGHEVGRSAAGLDPVPAPAGLGLAAGVVVLDGQPQFLARRLGQDCFLSVKPPGRPGPAVAVDLVALLPQPPQPDQLLPVLLAQVAPAQLGHSPPPVCSTDTY